VERSPVFGRFLTVIPNGLDVDEFAPRLRDQVRDLLGIPRDARVRLFVAEELSSGRKGFVSLIDALAEPAGTIPNLVLLSVGQKRPELRVDVPWVHVGSLDSDRFLAIVFSAADLFAICSLQDNLPNTVLEAMACVIPVVVYAVGGIPDMVRNRVNGLTVQAADVGALAAAISNLLSSPAKCAEMGANARPVAVEDYSVELQARRYFDLYSKLV
jgi:glycosyltransferase involved in cell wall biosynthesis